MAGQALVIGAGMAGIQASLTLAEGGMKVYLVEREPLFGGKVIKFEEVFANMECSTCMAAPKQQEVLQNDRIELLTLSEVCEVEGEAGNFSVKIRKKAGYVKPAECIGCNACFEPCPVNIPNEFEERLGQRKAIYIPCAGALPNVPSIDTANCLRFTKGDECTLCKEACMFDAIDFDQKDEYLDIQVNAIIVATGYDLTDVAALPEYGYGNNGGVYTAVELERLYASNGPTQGKIQLRNGKIPASAAIIHCVGRKQTGYCSAVCCMSLLKLVHYFKHKLPDMALYEFYSDMCVPGKKYQEFYEHMKEKVTLIRCDDINVEHNNGKETITYKDTAGNNDHIEVDMLILAPAMVPAQGTKGLTEILGIDRGPEGFCGSGNGSPTESGRDGIYVAGCAQGPKDIGQSITQADAAAARVLSIRN
ncbi:MAG: CoB--CoM heterodisulfide reductase iron-sulfur subunit A family protein [Chitinispirillaceae bacterium]|nr:CoB--CoM heterodisulfide reductase iron-sulfur subunit A family protein [Chitinispirillaceae bacterium]